MRGTRSSPFALALLAIAACQPSPPPPPPAVRALPAAPPTGPRLDAILLAEQERNAEAIPSADAQSRDLEVRRAAVRAFSRIGTAPARAALLRALSDEDDEVVAWAAYGLGFFCRGFEKEHVSALVVRSLARSGLSAAAATQRAAAPTGSARAAASTSSSPSRLDADAAIARAIGRCAGDESEPTLVAWLAGAHDRVVSSSYALGDVASVKQKLREDTLITLLNLAAGSAATPPIPEALFPIGRLDHVPEAIEDRIREVATARLADAGDARLFAVRALGRAGEDAAPELTRVLTSRGAFTPSERAEAARALKRLGKSGQHALAEALPALVPSPDPASLPTAVGEDFGVLLVTLEGLETVGSARKPLLALATLGLPPASPLAVARRISWLRCEAAKLLVGENFRDRLLTECDVTGAAAAPEGDAGAPPPEAMSSNSIGARALVEVLGRGELTGARLSALKVILRGSDLRAREAAIELIESHEEIDAAAAPILTEALGAKEPGLVATAAEVLSKQPQRASEPVVARKPVKRGRRRRGQKEEVDVVEPAPPSPALVKALLAVLDRPGIVDDPEMTDSVVDAVGALSLQDARPRLEELCRSPYPTTRDHVAKALVILTGERRTCEPPSSHDIQAALVRAAPSASAVPIPQDTPPPAELKTLATAPIKLSLETDVGILNLSLDPTFAPVAVTRIADLARVGFYDGMIVHRVVPGFVVQFGAPFGDGFGGPEGRPSLRCETSPLSFKAMTVGMALAGRDTGSSQIFVAEGRYPHLDGQYAILGTATGAWSGLVDGDVIYHARVLP